MERPSEVIARRLEAEAAKIRRQASVSGKVIAEALLRDAKVMDSAAYIARLGA
jgi:hypothetical protein